jgi:hypothetical protein
MSAARPAMLRLAHVEQRAPVRVVTAADDIPRGDDVLILVDALSPSAGLGLGDLAHRSRIAVRCGLPGIGGRYLIQIARSAAAGGWEVDELAALVVELERRCTYLVLASTVVALAGAGRGRVLRRPTSAGWDAGTWTVGRGGARDVERSASASAARGYLCVASTSGATPPSAVSRELRRLSHAGVPVGQLSRGVAAALTASWAVELLGTPALSAPQLTRLREQFGSAPRCDWCGLPVVGRQCRRCSPGGSQ